MASWLAMLQGLDHFPSKPPASLHMTPSVVGLDCQLALKEWREQHRGSINETVELEWQLLNWAQIELRQAWEDSKDPKKRETLGDPRFIAEFVKAGAERRQLLGTDKPAKTESQTTVEVNMGTTTLTIDQLKMAIVQSQERLLGRKAEFADNG
jgi:hypothetical protein